jgi:hypothetical protein
MPNCDGCISNKKCQEGVALTTQQRDDLIAQAAKGEAARISRDFYDSTGVLLSHAATAINYPQNYTDKIRGEALEEAMVTQCEACALGYPATVAEDGETYWHDDMTIGTQLCRASAIRALKP